MRLVCPGLQIPLPPLLDLEGPELPVKRQRRPRIRHGNSCLRCQPTARQHAHRHPSTLSRSLPPRNATDWSVRIVDLSRTAEQHDLVKVEHGFASKVFGVLRYRGARGGAGGQRALRPRPRAPSGRECTQAILYRTQYCTRVRVPYTVQYASTVRTVPKSSPTSSLLLVPHSRLLLVQSCTILTSSRRHRDP